MTAGRSVVALELRAARIDCTGHRKTFAGVEIFHVLSDDFTPVCVFQNDQILCFLMDTIYCISIMPP